MNNTIIFPKLNNNNYVQICFIRKYRQNKKSYYVFYNVEIEKEISITLKGWLEKNIYLCNNKSFSSYNPSNYSNKYEYEYEYFNFESLDKWTIFSEKAFTIQNEKVELSDIKRNLIGYIIYVKIDGFILGQIRKLSPSNVLDKKGFYRLFFDNSKFNDLQEETGLRIDKKADLVFIKSDEKSEAIIFDQKNFKLIFDMHEEEKKEAIKILDKISILKNHPDYDVLMQITSDDRIIQRMLINPVVKNYLNEIDYSTIKQLKLELGDKIAFKIDDENQQIIFKTGNEKKGIHDLIKTVTSKYNRSLNNKHIIESTPTRFLK